MRCAHTVRGHVSREHHYYLQRYPKWRAYYWDYFNVTTARVIEYGVPELWLGENLGMVVLSYERRDVNATGQMI